MTLDPYPGLSRGDVKGRLAEEDDMSEFLPLTDAPDGIFQLMKDCLVYESEQRPSFPKMVERLEKIEKELKADKKLNVWREDELVATPVQDNDYGYDEKGDD